MKTNRALISGLLARYPEKWNCHYKSISTPESAVAQVPGLDVLDFFKSKDYLVKVFQMLDKFLLFNQKMPLDKDMVQDLKVGIVQEVLGKARSWCIAVQVVLCNAKP